MDIWSAGVTVRIAGGEVFRLAERRGAHNLRKGHMGTEKSPHWYVRDRILREATPL